MKPSAVKIAWYIFGSLVILIPAVAMLLPSALGTSIGCGPDLMKLMVNSNGPVGMQIQAYHVHMNDYPTSLADLITRPSSDHLHRWQGPYLNSRSELIDRWNRLLRYR